MLLDKLLIEIARLVVGRVVPPSKLIEVELPGVGVCIHTNIQCLALVVFLMEVMAHAYLIIIKSDIWVLNKSIVGRIAITRSLLVWNVNPVCICGQIFRIRFFTFGLGATSWCRCLGSIVTIDAKIWFGTSSTE